MRCNIKYMRQYLLSAILILFFAQGFTQVITPETASKKARKYFDEGIQMAMNSNFEEAILAFNKAVEAEPRFITAYVFGADAYQQSGKHAEAENFLNKAIELQPDYDR